MKYKPIRNSFSKKKSKESLVSPSCSADKLSYPSYPGLFTMIPYYGRTIHNHAIIDHYHNGTKSNGHSKTPSFSGSSFRMDTLLSKDDTHCSNNYATYDAPARYPIVKYADKWACDYCQVATFATYQEACNHERYCKMNPKHMTEKGSATLTAPKHHENRTAPNMVVSSEKSTVSSSSSSSSSSPETKLLLCMPSDKQSLSDRQCYVRSNFVEIFEATDVDVSTRHSRGAQKLRVGQIGIRCMHCSHLEGRKRAERATCFPSSISRIYQTVADMQRFHFEACTGIPESMKTIYRNLKTTRPRGQGSPQSYWAKSARELGLVDTNEGIRLSKEGQRRISSLQQKYHGTSNGYSYTARSATSPTCTQQETGAPSSYYPITTYMSEDGTANLPPLSPESQSSQVTTSSVHKLIPDEEDANILLALRTGNVSNCNISRQSQ
jgi:hypothetical protein